MSKLNEPIGNVGWYVIMALAIIISIGAIYIGNGLENAEMIQNERYSK